MARPKQTTQISDQLRAFIQAKSMTGYELAILSGVHRSQISRFINGHAGLPIEAVDKISRVLELKLIATRRTSRNA